MAKKLRVGSSLDDPSNATATGKVTKAFGRSNIEPSDTIHVPHVKGYKMAVRKNSGVAENYRKAGVLAGSSLGYEKSYEEHENKYAVKNYRAPLKK